MNPHPTDESLLAALERVGRPRGEVVGWLAVEGDWLAAVAHADCAYLVMLPAGGQLWGEIPLGQKRFVTLREQSWAFVAEQDESLGSYQRCHLAEAADGISDIGVAHEVCRDALALLGYQPKPPAEEPKKAVTRRGFLGALVGRR